MCIWRLPDTLGIRDGHVLGSHTVEHFTEDLYEDELHRNNTEAPTPAV